MKVRVILVLALCLSVQVVAMASAHSLTLLKSEPAAGALLKTAPTQVDLWFAEEVVSQASTLYVTNRAGDVIDVGDGGVNLDDPQHASMRVTLPAPLPHDLYTVHWQIQLLDGDASAATFAFAVGEEYGAALSQAVQAISAAEVAEERTPAVGDEDQSLLLNDVAVTSLPLTTLPILVAVVVLVVVAGVIGHLDWKRRTS
ncbi:MAG: copper resistance protein CopC [Caldilineaceae bacterium]